MKIAVLFPGIGYTCDKPLLYYSEKLCRRAGYTVRRVSYVGFRSGIKGDPGKMRQAFSEAFTQTEALLSDIRWEAYEEILFIGKSIGTVVSTRYARARGLAARHILLTPLAETFEQPTGETIAFHGTADPWARTEEITELCRRRGVHLVLSRGANHSLETDDLSVDLNTLADTMDRIRTFL